MDSIQDDFIVGVAVKLCLQAGILPPCDAEGDSAHWE